jgi:glycosyltransferase involved in cell wall biosynthesis
MSHQLLTSLPGGSETPSLNIAIVSTFAPRACGLATFASDLAESLQGSEGVANVGIISLERGSDIAAMDSTNRENRPDCVKRVGYIRDDSPESYKAGATLANSWANVVLIQHEFGIFGGDDGELLLDFLNELTVPFVLTLHTVLPVFSPHQQEVLRLACQRAASVTVFTTTALRLLTEQQITDESKVVVVPHGAPNAIYQVEPTDAKVKLGMSEAFVLSSFGLVSPGKGLELAIEALPSIAQALPDVHLIIAGRTHPDIVRRNGESYRHSLQQLAENLGVTNRITFLDGFLDIEAIAELLAATDIFVTPYFNLDQIVSGALTFALAAGCPVVSTPYLYAIDQLADGAGTIVAGRSSDAFAAAVIELSNPLRLAAAKHRSAEIGASMHWPVVGQELASLATAVSTPLRSDPISVVTLPSVASVSLSESLVAVNHTRTFVDLARPVAAHPPSRHLKRLIDDRGIVQHATGVVPLLSSGYCVDDIARLIPIALQRSGASETPDEADSWESVFTRCLAVLCDAHAPGSSLMKNFLNWSGAWLDQPHFGDHVGRSLLGLASVPHTDEYMTVVAPVVASMLEYWPAGGALHPDAYALVAQYKAPHFANRSVARGMLDRLVGSYQEIADGGWVWPEKTVRYDQGRFPHALLAGGLLLEDHQAVELGLESLNWLTGMCDQRSYLRFPGHRGWSPNEPLQWSGDEQPLEALAFIEAHRCAYEITGLGAHVTAAQRGLDWFYGANRLGQSLGDRTTGACCDGLGSFDVNKNCGAESTLALALAHAEIAALYQMVHPSSFPISV